MAADKETIAADEAEAAERRDAENARREFLNEVIAIEQTGHDVKHGRQYQLEYDGKVGYWFADGTNDQLHGERGTLTHVMAALYESAGGVFQ